MGLMVENAKIREAVLNSVTGLSDEDLNRKQDPEKWSIAQVLVHLYLLEKGVAKGITYALENGQEQPVDAKPIHMTPDRSKKFKAPASVEPRDEFYTLAKIKDKLEQSRGALYAALEGVGREELEKKSLPHPVFGPTNLKQWVELVGLHEKRHLEQIEEIKTEIFGK